MINNIRSTETSQVAVTAADVLYILDMSRSDSDSNSLLACLSHAEMPE